MYHFDKSNHCQSQLTEIPFHVSSLKSINLTLLFLEDVEVFTLTGQKF